MTLLTAVRIAHMTAPLRLFMSSLLLLCFIISQGTLVTGDTTACNVETDGSCAEDVKDTQSVYQQCRRAPSWPKTLKEDCRQATNFNPDQYDVLEGSDEEFFLELRWKERIQNCLEEKQQKRGFRKTDPLPDPAITSMHPSKTKTGVATVSFALNEEEATAVQDLTACAKQYHESAFFQERAFPNADDEGGTKGGNDVTFLNGLLQLFVPGVAAQLKQVAHQVWKEARWDQMKEPGTEFPMFPDPLACGIRTSEHLSYRNWGALGEHSDEESYYTILVALSDPESYEGGEFFVRPPLNDTRVVLKPPRLTAVVFLSEQKHGVQALGKDNTREMFTTELWEHGDASVGVQRPSRNLWKRFQVTGSWEEPEGPPDDLYEQCRMSPRWKQLDAALDANRDDCQEITGYNPDKHNFIKGCDEQFTARGWVKKMKRCIDQAEKQREPLKHCGKEEEETDCTVDNAPIEEPEITGMYPSVEDPVFATVSLALSEQEAATVQELAACIREHHPDQLQHRAFEDALGEEDQKGGNDVTFLEGFLQIFAPGILAQVYRVAHMVWEEADWGNRQIIYDDDDDDDEEYYYPDPLNCGVRTTEHLSYSGWKSLGRHVDGDSLYTILIALADPSDYEGGSFYIDPSNREDIEMRISAKPQRLTATVFLSEEFHGVEDIRSPGREMFTTELWAGGDVTIGIVRPEPEAYQDFLETGSWDLD